MDTIDVRPARPQDAEFVRGSLIEHFTSTDVAAHDELIDATALPALIAWAGDSPAGHLTYRAGLDSWEVVSLASSLPGRGAGTALLNTVREEAQRAGVTRIWLVTTNDNTDALRFYQRWGLDLVRIDRGAVTRLRRLKPGIPTHAGGIAIRHEIELEMVLADPV
jgi:GNAT superfamily N-acetyltransferase